MNYILVAVLSVYFGAAFPVGQRPVKSLTVQNSQAVLTSDQESSFCTYLELLRTDVTKNKVQIVGQVMQLNAQNAPKFWPIYTEFEAEYKKFGYRSLALILNYAANYNEMTPQVADQLANKLLDIEQERGNLKRRYYQKLKEALNPITAAKFIQVENQIERILDLQILSQPPVIEAPRSSQL
jgi:hypothetical protein